MRDSGGAVDLPGESKKNGNEPQTITDQQLQVFLRIRFPPVLEETSTDLAVGEACECALRRHRSQSTLKANLQEMDPFFFSQKLARHSV